MTKIISVIVIRHKNEKKTSNIVLNKLYFLQKRYLLSNLYYPQIEWGYEKITFILEKQLREV